MLELLRRGWALAVLALFGLPCGCASVRLVTSEANPPKANGAKYVLMEKRQQFPAKAFEVPDGTVRWYNGFSGGHWSLDSYVGRRRKTQHRVAAVRPVLLGDGYRHVLLRADRRAG